MQTLTDAAVAEPHVANGLGIKQTTEEHVEVHHLKMAFP